MGMPKINNQPIITPSDEMSVADLKRLAEISDLEQLYDLKSGRVLANNEVVDTREAAYGSTMDWERG
jgi:hypothetical protein